MKIVPVGVGECELSRDPGDVLVTYALGSCIAILLYEPQAGVAGLLHFMLPASEIAANLQDRPFVFADTGIPLLFQNAYKLGAEKTRINVAAFGGAHVMDPEGAFAIGKRNQLAMKRILCNAGVPVRHEDVGGTLARTVRIEVSTGRILLQHGDEKKEITDLTSSPAIAHAASPGTAAWADGSSGGVR